MKHSSFSNAEPAHASYCWEEAEAKIVRLRRYSRAALIALLAVAAMALSACSLANAPSLTDAPVTLSRS